MLSQIGYISLPVELVEKLYYGKRLTPEERVLADGAPPVAQKLLGRIPRLEPVMEILAACQSTQNGVARRSGQARRRTSCAWCSNMMPRLSRAGASRPRFAIRAQPGRFDNKLMENLESMVGLAAGTPDQGSAGRPAHAGNVVHG